MVEHERVSTQEPVFSIIVAVYNDWTMLEGCLQSLVQQTDSPSFEVILVDDGSAEAAPEFVRGFGSTLSLMVIRQPHTGIPSARNRGIRGSKGEMLLFVDADCRLHGNCLAALGSKVTASPQHNCFQLQLVGNRSSLVGRAEELRLITFQSFMLQPDGRIRYLNTAGFAIRRGRVDVEAGLFNPAALRSEDTLLLASLMQRGELPLFVPEAVVEHHIPLSLIGCFRKDVRSAYLEGPTFDMIASKGIRIRLTHRERLRLLWSTWKTAGQDSIGRSAWLVLVLRQAIQRTISFGYHYLRIGSNTRSS